MKYEHALLKKVEELALYVIELKGENKADKADNVKRKEAMDLLIKEVNTMKKNNK